jgi:hypothetical protein
MRRILAFFPLLLLTLGNSRAADDFPGYEKQSGDLGAFILRHAAKFGARVQKTNDLPQLIADWRYVEEADGIQIYVPGDYFAPLQSFLTAAYGPPAKPPTTNEVLGTKNVGTYYGPQLGAALHYGWERTRNGKQTTSLVVVSVKR